MVFQTQTSKDGAKDKAIKAKLSDVYHSKSHMKCYNFCQQCKNHFAIIEAIKPNQIPFTTFFL